MINRKQLEALHRALPEEWAPRDQVRTTIMELCSLPEFDRAAGEALLLSLSLAGVAQHSNGGRLWRRGVLPPALSPLEELQAAEARRIADMRREQQEELERRERANRYAEAVHQAPERARACRFIDERLREWLVLLGFTAEQIDAAATKLSDPMNVPPLAADPPRFVTTLPPGAIVTAI